jgi:murein L,D-transpeptidase YcbB/YkuD
VGHIGDRRSLGQEPSPGAEPAAVSAAIRALLEGSAPAPSPWSEAERKELAAFYGPAALPAWIGADGESGRARGALELLGEAEVQGLSPADYAADALSDEVRRLEEGPPTAPAIARLDTALSAEVLRFLQHAHGGRVRPAEVGFAYHHDAEGAGFARRVARAVAEDGLRALAAELEPPFAQYRRLKAALAEYRRAPLSDATARANVRQVELALERLRWLPHDLPGRFLVANVPAYRLVAFEHVADERPALQMGIVVGRAARSPTPLFVGELTEVVFRPSWYPTANIIRNEIVPAARRDPRFLERQRMDLVAATDDASPAVPATSESLELLRAGRLFVRQRPGPHNALGLVKFVFPNDYRVYMHGTPAGALFARSRRDFSHGCIRLERPAELARLVLSGREGWTKERIEAAMDGSRSIRVGVSPSVPVFVFYTTVVVRADGVIEFFDDVYGLDATLERALRRPSPRSTWAWALPPSSRARSAPRP